MAAIQLWPDQEANAILERHGADPNKTYLFETGFGPSGKPHFGTFGEVVRTNYVMLAMQDLGYKTKLIAFSDDLDGLRKVPENFPSWLKDYIGKPVSSIPDPFDDQHESFSAHMNALLVEMLDNMGLDYQFQSSVEAYKAGHFNKELTTVIQNYELVQEVIFPYLRDETKETWFPFLPICENCGKVGMTRVTGVDKEKLLVSYACDKEFGGQPGCGHHGTMSPLNGTGKLQWKVDWPTRWHAYGVVYEMFGKDLIESAEVGDKIVQRVFKGIPPQHMFYELFLDEDAKKISKSKGRGMTAETWLRYGNYDSLSYLMLDKPREAKRLYVGVIPRYMEMTTKAAQGYYGGEEKLAREARHYKFIKRFKPDVEPPVLVDFSTLSNFIGNVGLSNPAIVQEYLTRSNMLPATLTPQQQAELTITIEKAKLFYDEVMADDLTDPEFDAIEGYLLGQAIQYLESGEYDAEAIHHAMFDIPKNHGVEPGKFFRALYLALIKQERGPRAGSFIKLLGQDTAASLIKERLLVPPQPKVEKPVGTLVPVMIAPEVKERYPELRLGVAVIEGVKVSNKRPDELNKLIYQAVQQVAGGDAEYNARIEQGAIGAYRQLFQTFGVNPSAMLPSPANILRLALYDNRLPAVSNLVDATNLTVLETGISVAVYDVDQLSLPLTLRFAQEGDSHLPLGSKQYENVKAGELIYADDAEVICRALNHRDSDKTKVTPKTTRVLLILDGAPGISSEALLAALQVNIGRIQQYAGGVIQSQTLLM